MFKRGDRDDAIAALIFQNFEFIVFEQATLSAALVAFARCLGCINFSDRDVNNATL